VIQACLLKKTCGMVRDFFIRISVTSQKSGVWGIFGWRSQPKIPHFPLFIEMIRISVTKLKSIKELK
jgi:hypothetical protein